MESAEKYKKTEGAYKECSVHYEKIIAQMKNSFVSEYDDTIKTIADKIGDDVEKVDDKEALKNAVSEFTTFKDTLKNDFENYNTVEQDSFDEYNSTIDDYVTKYNDRVTTIEKAEEEARKKAEEEAKKKAEEEAAAKAAQEEAERKAAEEAAEQSSGSSSSGSSYYDDSNDYSYSSGNSSSGYSDSGSGSDSSGGLSSSDGSSSSGSGIPSGANYGWAEDGAGRVENYYDPSTGDTWDANGNYSGNMNDWLWD